MTEFPTMRQHQQAAATARSRILAIINDPDLSVVVIFALTGLLATLVLAMYLPPWAAAAFSAQLP